MGRLWRFYRLFLQSAWARNGIVAGSPSPADPLTVPRATMPIAGFVGWRETVIHARPSQQAAGEPATSALADAACDSDGRKPTIL